MSVRATGSLIADLVKVTGIPESPVMVVKCVDEEKKLVTTVWFSEGGKAQSETFPAKALDRIEEAAPKVPKAAPTGAKRGRKPKAA
jgi:hypothetical protein